MANTETKEKEKKKEQHTLGITFPYDKATDSFKYVINTGFISSEICKHPFSAFHKFHINDHKCKILFIWPFIMGLHSF